MKITVNTETAGLTILHEWMTVVFHDICYHTNLPEKNLGRPRKRSISQIWETATGESQMLEAEEQTIEICYFWIHILPNRTEIGYYIQKQYQEGFLDLGSMGEPILGRGKKKVGPSWFRP
jgi:hypothetical protein